MKKLLPCLIILFTASMVFAQGKLNFRNDSLHLVYFTTDTSVLLPEDAGLAGQAVPVNGNLPPSGVSLVAELWAGTSSSSLQQVIATNFAGSTAYPGTWVFENIRLPFAGGSNQFFQVMVYDANAGSYANASMVLGYYFGQSPIFTCNSSAGIVYNSIVNANAPSDSTWAVGDYPLDSVTVGAKGAIELKANTCINSPQFNLLPRLQDQAVWIGQPATFSTTALYGYQAMPVWFQWSFNGTNILGANGSSYSPGYVITNAQMADAGTYSITATNCAGGVATESAVLQVLPFGAPSISVNGRLAVEAASSIASAQLSIAGGFTNGINFYTIDGTTPTTGSPLYSGPIILTNSAMVQAMSLSADFSQTAYAPAIQVQIIPAYNLETSVVGNGTVTLSDGNPYPSNSIVILTATAAVGWSFDHWTEDATGTQNPTMLTMNGPRNVQAVFVQTAYPLTITTPGGGSVTANGQVVPPSTFFTIGSLVALAATASSGWTFVGWQGDATGTNNPLNLTINQTNNVQGIFGTVVGTNISGPGSVVLSLPNPVPFGTLLTATAVATPGYYLKVWNGSASGTNATSSFLVTSPTPTVGALFTAAPAGEWTLNTAVNGTGNVSVNPQKPYYDTGNTVTLTASTTNAGTSFSGWSGDAAGMANPLTVVMSTNKIIVANFVSLPSVSISPQNLTVLAGSNALLTANAVGLPPISYQWFQGVGPLSAATNATYAIQSAQASDAGSYTVVVSNSYGSATSAVAVVTVVFPPSFVQQPSNTTVAAGTALTLTAASSGTAPLSYQWWNGAGAIANATNASYMINPIQTNNADAYFVVVTNLYGAITSAVAAVTVYVPVSITGQPASQVVPARSTISFIVLAGGYPPPAYQWRFWGTNLPGATWNSLSITNVRLSDLGNYAVFVNNGYSSLLSANASLSMSPSITSPFLGATAIWGRSASLSVAAIGTGLLSFQWYKDGVAVATGTNATLNMPTVQLGDGGFYSVVVSSDLGSVTNSAQFVVNPAGVDLGLYAGITISGVAGYSYEIQYTTDLTVTNSWATLTNLTLDQPVQLWVDTTTNAAATHLRFYRILPGQ